MCNYLAVVADSDEATTQLVARIPARERGLARRLRGDRRRRQFVLGRLAAHQALLQLHAPRGGTHAAAYDILAGADGAPLLRGQTRDRGPNVTIAHSGRIGVACAWEGTSARYGVDVERIRSVDILRDPLVFAPDETRLLQMRYDGHLAGLVGWTIKEACWKALAPPRPPTPQDLRLLAFAGTEAWIYTSGPDGAQSTLRFGLQLRKLRSEEEEYLLTLVESRPC
jgi:4'-phosphopantetheinyl transferase EntD